MMHKKDFIEEFAKRNPVLNKVDAEKAYESFIEILVKAIKAGDKFTMSSFGTFKLKNRKARMARNPKTGATVKVAASKTITFKATASLKESL